MKGTEGDKRKNILSRENSMCANMEAMDTYIFKEQENKRPRGSRVEYEKQRSIKRYKKGEGVVTRRPFSSPHSGYWPLCVKAFMDSMHSEGCFGQGLIR